MTTREQAQFIGKHGKVRITRELALTGVIEDVKMSYGIKRYLVSIDGQDASLWVNEDSFTMNTVAMAAIIEGVKKL